MTETNLKEEQQSMSTEAGCNSKPGILVKSASYPDAPDGKVLYRTSLDGQWLEADASIDDGAFFGFAGKEDAVEVVIPSKDASGNDVTIIVDYAFYGCSSLTSVMIPNGVTAIGDSAFS